MTCKLASYELASDELGRGLISTQPTSDTDRRSVNLSLTAKGQNLLRELGAIRRASNDKMYGSLTKEKARILQEIIDALIQDAEIALHELSAPDMLGRKALSVQSDNPIRAGRSLRR